jgi:hypothetical protein
VLQTGVDSTGQRITLIVIGLLLAALALAVLTAWYYRVTDPGPRQKRSSKRSGGSSDGGGDTSQPPDPKPGPGWRRRLSSFNPPESGRSEVGTEQASTAKKADPKKSASKRSLDKKTEKEPTTARAKDLVVSPVNEPASESQSPTEPTSETVSLEGGYYLDLTDIPSSQEPPTNVSSLNALDLRQPAPLKNPEDYGLPVPTVPSPEQSSVKPDKDNALSFDEWLAGVEAIEE